MELQRLVDIGSNLLAHHLDVLERVGLIQRSRSSGDGRRRYVHVRRDAFVGLEPGTRRRPTRALFVCTHNSARSQLAAALWRTLAHAPAESAGTDPANRVHPGAVAAAARAGLDLSSATPRRLDEVGHLPSLVVTVCDRAHETIDPPARWLHWSIPDPVASRSKTAFDLALTTIRDRIATVVDFERIRA